MENGNTQVTPEAPAPAQDDVAAYKAKLAELEKQSEGRLRDLQAERQKRQELEAKLNNPTPAPSPANQDVTQDELGKVLKPYIDPVMNRVKQAEAFVQTTYLDKTAEFLSQKTGKAKDGILNDEELTQKLVNVAKRFQLQGNVYDVTRRAYDIMELESLKDKEAERRRVADAAKNQSLPSGNNAPAQETHGAKEYSEKEFNEMPLHEYDKLVDAGSFLMNESGKVVYTPRPK